MELTECKECGMLVEVAEYHPYAACLMFQACQTSATVRDNLEAINSTPSPSTQKLIVSQMDDLAVKSLSPEMFEKWREIADHYDKQYQKEE